MGVVSNVELEITDEDLTQAVEQHARAKAMITQAEKLAETGRAVIMAYIQQHPDDILLDAEGKTATIIRGEFRSRVTFPVSADTVDENKLRETLRDILDPGDLEALFMETITVKFNAEFLPFMPVDDAARVLKLRTQYTTPGQPLSPRVSSGKAPKIKRAGLHAPATG